MLLYVIMLISSLVWLFAIPTELNSLYVSMLEPHNYLLMCIVVFVMAIIILLINIIARAKNKKYEVIE